MKLQRMYTVETLLVINLWPRQLQVGLIDVLPRGWVTHKNKHGVMHQGYKTDVPRDSDLDSLFLFI